MNNLVESVFKEEMTQKGLKDLKKKYPEDLKVDMSNDVEFKAARKTRTEKNKLVDSINRRRLDIVTELKKYSDGIINTIEDIYEVVTLPFEKENERRKVEAEKAAKLRQEKLNKELEQIKDIGNFYDSANGKPSEEISRIIESVDLIEVDVFDKELIHEAIEIKKVTLERLDTLLSDTKRSEILDAEREKLEEESATAAKKAAIVERLNTLKMISTTMFGKSSEDIGKKIESINNFSITDEEFGDLVDEAKDAVKTVVSQLEAMENQQKMVEDAAKAKADQEAREAEDKYEALMSEQSENKEDKENLPAPYVTGDDFDDKQPEDDIPFTDQEDVPSETPEEGQESIDIKGFLEWAVNDDGLITDFGYLLISDDPQHNSEAADSIKAKFGDYVSKELN